MSRHSVASRKVFGTSGNASRRFREPASHAELVLRNPETGELECFSCHAISGITFNSLTRICKAYTKPGRHRVTLRPVRQFTEQGLIELNATIRELKTLSANLNAISTRLERDFSSLHGACPDRGDDER